MQASSPALAAFSPPGFLGTRIRSNASSTATTPARRAAPVCAAAKRKKGPPPPPPAGKKPAADGAKKSGGSSFAGMGAGPGRKATSTFGGMAAGPPRGEGDGEGDEQGQRKGVLGKAVRPGPPAIPRKTAADFIAEGVVDDVDEIAGDYVAEDIRFAVDDVRDPFLGRAGGKGSVGEEGGGGKTEKAGRVARNAAVAKAKAEAAGRGVFVEEDEGGGGGSTGVGEAGGEAVDIVGDGGVSKRVLVAGSGEEIPEGATVTVEYVGRLADGKEFDSSRKREGGFSFVLGDGRVIKGWEAAVSTMRLGEKAEIVVSPAYGYGRRGMPPVIPGSATLTFEVEVVKVEGGKERGGLRDVPDFNPGVARTVEDIDAEYVRRLATQKERRDKMTLLERFYIISPFASQTGERPPWYLNPRITFLIVFVVVAASFYVVVASDGVHQGYVKGPVDVNPFNKF